MGCDCIDKMNTALTKQGFSDYYIDTVNALQNWLDDPENGVGVIPIRTMRKGRESRKPRPFIAKFCPICGVRYFPETLRTEAETPPERESQAAQMALPVTHVPIEITDDESKSLGLVLQDTTESALGKAFEMFGEPTRYSIYAKLETVAGIFQCETCRYWQLLLHRTPKEGDVCLTCFRESFGGLG